MLYYLLFRAILGFIFYFYIIFGTNLLTGGPAQNCSFLPISVFRRNGISNGVQTEWNLRERDFLTEHDLGDLDPAPRNKRGGHEGGGAPLGAHPPISWAARSSSGPTPMLPGLLLVHKKSSKIGTSFGLCLVSLFCKTQKQGENRNWHWALGQ